MRRRFLPIRPESSNPAMAGRLRAGVVALLLTVSLVAAGSANAVSLYVGESLGLIVEVDPLTGTPIGATIGSILGTVSGLAFSKVLAAWPGRPELRERTGPPGVGVRVVRSSCVRSGRENGAKTVAAAVSVNCCVPAT